MRSWIRRREERGAYHQLHVIRELAVEDAPAFMQYFRTDKEKFNDLVGRIIGWAALLSTISTILFVDMKKC